MIHSIHRGEQLENGFTVGSHDYSDVVYPGDLRNCDTCHVNNSQQVPVDSDCAADDDTAGVVEPDDAQRGSLPELS